MFPRVKNSVSPFPNSLGTLSVRGYPGSLQDIPGISSDKRVRPGPPLSATEKFINFGTGKNERRWTAMGTVVRVDFLFSKSQQLPDRVTV